MLNIAANDAINAIFEGGGAVCQMLSVRRLLKDKKVEGISFAAPSFFTVWGIWNVHYYSALQQPLSWTAGAVLCAMNIVWLSLAICYSRRNLCAHI